MTVILTFYQLSLLPSLQSHLSPSETLYVAAYSPPAPAFDPSAIILLLIAIITIFLGSYIANEPLEFLR